MTDAQFRKYMKLRDNADRAARRYEKTGRCGIDRGEEASWLLTMIVPDGARVLVLNRLTNQLYEALFLHIP